MTNDQIHTVIIGGCVLVLFVLTPLVSSGRKDLALAVGLFISLPLVVWLFFP